MLYCEKCALLCEHSCPNCGPKKARRLRAPRADDPVLLCEKQQLWSAMVEDALKDAGIPFLRRNMLGAALTVYVGSGGEVCRYFVNYADYERAAAVVGALFPADC